MRSISSSRFYRLGSVLLLRSFIISLLMLTMTAGTACAGGPMEFRHKFSPGILTAHGDWTVSLKYDLGLSTELWSQPERESFRKNLSAHVGTRGTVAAEADLNTEPLAVDAGFTTAINLYRPAKVTLGDKPGEYHTEEEGFNYGRLDFSLLAGYETDQRLDNRNVTGGVELGYVLTENLDFKALIPAVFVGYDFVYIDHSRLQEQLRVNDESFRRFRVFASWKFPVGQWLPPQFDPLNAHLDVRYFLSEGIPGAIRAADRADAIYVAGGLSYSFGAKPLLGFVNSVYVRVASGRIPPVTEGATTVTFGLAVWER